MLISVRAICSARRLSWNNPGNNPAVFLLLFALVSPSAWAADPVTVEPQAAHALSLHGQPKYPADFNHLDYVNPDAPKGGNINDAVIGSFDTLNPYILKGLPPEGMSLIYETLLSHSLDEPLTSYGLIAGSVTVPEDRSWVSFELRPEARWQDGKPITSADVVWSFKTLLKQGRPFYRSYYAQVKDVTAVDAHHVKFTFRQTGNRELPLIIGDLPILPKHYWTDGRHDFAKTTLTPPLGSGPYRIKSVQPGRRIVYERDKNWWGRDLAINKGRYNFDAITMDYYRDPSVAFQAFLAGSVDFRMENIAKTWAQGYNHPAVAKGLIRKEEIKHELPTGMQAFGYNMRRPIFHDPNVREALAYAFDFEWSNKQLAFGSYTRCNSYFSNSELGATMPIGEDEKSLLAPYWKLLPPRALTKVYQPPRTNGSGDARQNLRHALQLLRKSGWRMEGGVLKNVDGKPFTFEILVNSPMFDRWLLPFVGNLKKLGVTATIRQVDAAQYQNRLNDFDFDMTVDSFPQSLTPGNEQNAYWHSSMADTKGSMNLIGVKNPVVDILIEKIIQAPTREALVTATRAMDRVLLWNFYVIPQWYIDTFRIAYWHKLGRPKENPPYGLPVLETWWVKE